MGSGFGVKCKACSASWEGSLGIGLRYSEERMKVTLTEPKSRGSMRLFSDDSEIQGEIASLMNQNASLLDYEHSAYLCAGCHWIESKFYISIKTLAAEEIYTPKYKCSKCRNALIRIKMEQNENDVQILDEKGNEIPWKCPLCNGTKLVKDNLSAQNDILWD